MINFEDGVLVTPAKVNQDGTITPAQYSGKTPLSAYTLNKMQELIEIYTGTNISAKTIEGACKIKKISGYLNQETRSGKNKFISLGNNTIAGITITENEDGTYNFSGTAAANIEHTAFINVEKSDIKNGSTYILSSTKTLPTGLSSRVERYTDSAWLGQFITSITSTIPTRTGVADTTDTTRFRFGIFISSGTTLNIQNVGFQLEEGTVATEYEQYGVSPSPDYSSEIRVVGDNINLIKNFNDYSTYGITATNNADGSLSITGTSSASNTTNYLVAVKKILVENIKDRDYTFLFKRSNTKNSIYARVRKYDGTNKTQIAYIHLANKITTYTLNIKELIDDNTVWVEVDIVTFSSTEYNEKLYIQLKKSTVSTSYTNYGIGGIDVKIAGKNLIGVKDTSLSTNLGITAEYDSSTGIYTLNGTSTNAGYIKLYDVLEVSTYADLNTRNRTLMSKGDYTLSYKYISGSKTTGTANIMIRDCDDNVDLQRYEISKIETQNKQLQFSVSEDYLTQKYIWFAKNITFTNFKFTIQLENGDVVTEHEPYKEENKVIKLPKNVFLAKIGNVQDYIDNKGILQKNIDKIVLNGSENWLYNESWSSKGDNTNAFYISRPTNMKEAEVVSSHFPYVASGWNYDEIGISVSYYLIIRVPKTITTVDELKTWLSNNNVTVYYILSEPYTVNLNFNNIIPQYAEQTNIISNAELEVEFTNSPAIASVNETISKISDETVAINSDCPNNKNVWIQKNDNLIGTLKINDIDTATGLEVEYDKFVITQDYIPVESNTNYYAEYVSNSSGGKQIVVYEYDNNHNYLNYHHINDKKYYFSTYSNSAYIKIRFMDTNININAVLRKGNQKIWTKNNGIYEEFINVDDVISNQFKRNDRYDSTDFNNFTKNGFYMVNEQNCTNAPNPYATGMLLVFGGYYISQLFIADLNGTTVGYMRISSDKGNTWNNWSQITTKE